MPPRTIVKVRALNTNPRASLGLTIPQPLVRLLDWADGDRVVVQRDGPGIRIDRVVRTTDRPRTEVVCLACDRRWEIDQREADRWQGEYCCPECQDEAQGVGLGLDDEGGSLYR